MNHPNLVPTLGVGLNIAELCLVSPWMSEGDLLHYLRNFPNANRVSIVRAPVIHAGECTKFGTKDDWSRRWAFLSPFQRHCPRIIERGQPSQFGRFRRLTVVLQTEILFDDAGIPRIADFGFSSIIFDNSSISKTIHIDPIQWTAPEILQVPDGESGRRTKMSDVYAFGMVVVEVRCHYCSRRLRV